MHRSESVRETFDKEYFNVYGTKLSKDTYSRYIEIVVSLRQSQFQRVKGQPKKGQEGAYVHSTALVPTTASGKARVLENFYSTAGTSRLSFIHLFLLRLYYDGRR